MEKGVLKDNIWKEADRIADRIRSREPEFGEYKVSVVEFGAVAYCEDGINSISKEEELKLAKHNTGAIYKAICHVAAYERCDSGKLSGTEKAPIKKGGTVIIPKGVFYTGSIHLESNVSLHLEEGAVLRFGTDTGLYAGDFLEEMYGVRHVRTRFEGVELMNYSPFIYGFGKENIAITGSGTIDGQASEENWHLWKAKKTWQAGERPLRAQDMARVRLFLQGEQDVPLEERVYGEASDIPGKCDDGYLRPSFIQLYCCRNVLIEGVRIVRSPMWEIHPVLCENVSVRGVHIDTHLSNNDGIDPECCKDVLIEKCYIDVGDDCIAIKSGRNQDARRIGVGTENIVIQNNVFADGHGGITLGSEISSGVRSVYVRHNVMESPRLWSAIRFKTNGIRGGIIEQCYFKDNEIRQLEAGKKPVLVETQYEIVTETAIFTEHGVSYHRSTPVLREIYIEGLTREDADVRGENISPDITWC